MIRPTTLILLALLAISWNTYSQEVPTFEKKIYMSPEGKLFISKELPLYIRLSTSPEEGAPSYLLQSESTKAYANPMYLDTEGYNTLRSPSCVDTTTKKQVLPERDIIFEMYADSKSPVSKASFGKVLTIVKQGRVYCGGLTEVSLTAHDELSGIQVIYFSVDSGAFQKYEAPIALNTERRYLLQYFSVDNVGNVENVTRREVFVDASNPSTKMSIKGDFYNDTILSGKAVILLEAWDTYGIKGVFFSLDGSAERTVPGPLYAANLREGEHVLEYYSVDNLSNKEPLKTFRFYVDKTAPTILEEIVGKTFVANGKEFSSGRSRLKLTTFDNKAGVKEVYYSINNAPYELYTKPVVLTNTSGSLSIKSYAIDFVNNRSEGTEQTARTSVPYVDLSGPDLSYSFAGPLFQFNDTTFVSHKTKINLRGKDNESGFNRVEYSLNGGEVVPYNGNLTLNKPGLNTIDFYGYDNVDNSNRSTFSVVVDTAGPALYSRFSIPNTGTSSAGNGLVLPKYPLHTVLFLSSTDAVTGFDRMLYSVNKSQYLPSTGMLQNFKEGQVNLKVKLYDKLGNLNTDSVNFIIAK